MPELLPDSPAQAQQYAELARACTGLWLATLSLMTAYMQQPATAHRVLLARRIARNLDTLGQQRECFGPGCRDRFAWLAARWQRRAEEPRREGLAALGASLRRALLDLS